MQPFLCILAVGQKNKIKWNKTLIWSAWVFNCLHTMTDWIQRFNLLVKFIEIYKTLSNIYRNIRGLNDDRHLSRLFFFKKEFPSFLLSDLPVNDGSTRVIGLISDYNFYRKFFVRFFFLAKKNRFNNGWFCIQKIFSYKNDFYTKELCPCQKLLRCRFFFAEKNPRKKYQYWTPARFQPNRLHYSNRK